MFGPAFGHNIKPFLSYYNELEGVKLTLVYSGANSHQSEFSNVKFIRLSLSTLLMLSLEVIRGKYNVLWLHGGNRLSIPLGIFIKLFKPRVLSVFNLWGEGVLRHSERSKLYYFFAKYAFSGFSIIQCNWFTLENQFKIKFPKLRTKTMLWGINENYFKNNVRESVKSEIDAVVSEDSYNFFFPKTISSHSEHGLLISAFEQLKGLNWHLYLLEGNGRDEQLFNKLVDYIETNGLNEQITFLKFSSYLQPSEMGYLWRKMDCGLQIVRNDQLSNTLVEPIIYEKDVLASNIPQYRDFNKYFNVNIELVDNREASLSLAFKRKLIEDKPSSVILKQRMETVIANYSFEDNVSKIHKFHELSALKK